MNIRELIDVATQALEYVKETTTKPHFIQYANEVIHRARAFYAGETLGRQQGWDVFTTDKDDFLTIQKDDDADLLKDDEEAFVLARQAGIYCDYEGYLLDGNGQRLLSRSP